MMHRFIRTIAVFSVVLGLGLVTTASAASSADLSVSIKEETTGPYAPGSLVTYRIRAFNEATSTASSYGVYTTVAASSVAPLIPVPPASDSNCILSMPSKTFVCEYFRVDAGKAKFQTISFRVPDTLTSCPLAVSPKVQIASRLTPDLNTANNINKSRPDTAIQCVANANADLQVTQRIISILGEDTTIATVTVTNNGPAIAQSVKMTQAMPAGLALIPEQSYPFCSQLNGEVHCNGATMKVGQTISFPIAYKTTLPCTPRSVTFSSSVTSATLDTSTINNQVQSMYGITCPPTISSQITITQKTTASTDTALKNQKNVNLLRFEARANQVTDLLLTGATFTANNLTNGSAQLTLVNAQNYTLWVDTNADGIVDTILQSGRAAQGGEVSFYAIAGGGYVVPKNQSVIFEVHADISSSFNTAQPQLQLAFKTTSSFVIEAETLADGSSLFGNQIQLSTVPSTLYTLRSVGDLSLAESTTPVRSHQLLGGTLSDEVLRFDLRAEYEDSDITQLVFRDAFGSAVFTQNIDRLELYKVGAVTPFTTATLAACASASVPAPYVGIGTISPNSLCAIMNTQQLIVAKGSITPIIVRARMRSDVDGAVSGSTFRVTIDPTTISARGFITSNDITTSGSSIVSPSHAVTLSKITSITSVDPNANGTAIPTGVNKAIGQFRFSTAAASNTKNGLNKFTLHSIIFNVNAQNVQLDPNSFKMYNKADPTVTSPCSIVDQTPGSPNLFVACWDALNTIDTQIQPGTDATFVLSANIINSKTSSSMSSFLQVSLQNLNTATDGMSSSMSHIMWLDQDLASSTQFFWIDYPETSVNGTQYQN